MKKNNKIFVIVCTIALALFMTACSSKNNDIDNSEANLEESELTLDEITLDKINEMAQNYYLQFYVIEGLKSQYSYLTRADGVEITIFDIAEVFQFELPEEFEDITIHLVQPLALLDYPNLIIDDSDANFLTVYTALPLDDGNVFISSVYDEGGVLTNSEYQEFVLKNSPIHGEIRNFQPNDSESEAIKAAAGEYDQEILNGNVKYLCYDDKYAMLVISSQNSYSTIKQFLLKNEDGNWQVMMSELESNDKAEIYINMNYPDFNLGMLPMYNLCEFSIMEGFDNITSELIEAGMVSEDDILTYECGAGKFCYLEFNSGYKILAYLNEEGTFDIYEVETYLSALEQMIMLDSENPPTFIINFEN